MRSKMILVLALVMGGVTTFLFFQYMKQFNTEVVMSENMVEVVVAKEIIRENQLITASMLEVTEMPQQGIHPQTIQSIGEIDGQFATADIEAGEPLLSHRLKSSKDETVFISRKVQEGYRALSIDVNFVQTVSNLIEPEDYVDVIFSETVKVNGEDTMVTEQLLNEKRVLAVGRKMQATTNPEEYVEYSSVTLELTPNDVVKLVNANERGNIHMALHTKVFEEAPATNE